MRRSCALVFNSLKSGFVSRSSLRAGRAFVPSSLNLFKSSLQRFTPIVNTREFHATKTLMSEDFYEILGVSKSSSQDEIKKAYRKLALQYHPDRNKGDKTAEQKLAKINAAYEVLRDEKKRQQYDMFGSGDGSGFEGGNPFEGFEGFGGSGGIDPEELFRQMGFGGFEESFSGKQKKRAMQGADIQLRVKVDFMETVEGTEKTVNYPKQKRCGTCNGKGAKPGSKTVKCKACGGTGSRSQSSGFFVIQTPCNKCNGEGEIPEQICGTCNGNGLTTEMEKLSVRIPRGIADGNSVRMLGYGHDGPKGGPSGNLYLNVSVGAHPLFERKGLDVHLNVPITVTQAILGADVSVPTLAGDESVKISPGTQPGEKKFLRGKGFKDVHSASLGSQIIHFDVVIPNGNSMSKKGRELIEEFKGEEASGNTRKSVFSKFADFIKGNRR